MAKTIDSQIVEIERRLLRKNHGGLGEATRSKPRLDTSKPNFHDKKADFIAEMSKVHDAMAAVDTLLELIVKSYEGNPDADAPEVMLRDHIDDKAASRTSEIELDSLVSLLRRNAGDVGLSRTLDALLFDYRRGLRSRYVVLLD